MTARRKPKPQSKLRAQDVVIVCAVGLFVLLLFARMLVFVFGHHARR
jgi:hypothetical protein